MSWNDSPDYGGRPLAWRQWLAAIALFLVLPVGLILLVSYR